MGALARGDLPWPLFVFGPAGVGKTCAALCLLDHVMPPTCSEITDEEGVRRIKRIGGETAYYTATGLAEAVIDCQQGRGELHPPLFWQRLTEKVLVVLDEIGARERVSDHHYDCVKRLLDDRHARPLIVLSNLSLEQVANVYDSRIASRMAAGTIVQVKGRDRRLPAPPGTTP
jgi:DNA replication protein DnaC